MPRNLSALLIAGFALALLAGCAGPGSGVTGNDTGGIIPYAAVSADQARDLATAHCAQYGKLPRARMVDAQYGGYYSFACRFDPRKAS